VISKRGSSGSILSLESSAHSGSSVQNLGVSLDFGGSGGRHFSFSGNTSFHFGDIVNLFALQG
jgi:hypothetical protein